MSTQFKDPFGVRATIDTGSGQATFFRLDQLEKAGVAPVSRLPFSIRVLLENLLRNVDGELVTAEDVQALGGWQPKPLEPREIPFMPARVLLQDFTGVPVVADLAAMRPAVAKLGGDPRRINPLIPVDLVIDHSVQVDAFGNDAAFLFNVEKEYERNRERYAFLKWAQKSFTDFRAVPPGTGICHQVNLEYLGRVVQLRGGVAYPDTLVGTDSHTTMINGLGVLGWGVGGIEAEAVMLGQPYYMLIPEVIGFKLTGELPEGATATDLVLTVTEMLRKKGVVEKFVEFYGPGLHKLSLADRATIANMAPEYGATMGFFPVDAVTLTYLRGTGREESHIQFVERYLKEQGLFHTVQSVDPQYTATLELDMSRVEPSMAGPRRPQDRVPLFQVKDSFHKVLKDQFGKDDLTPFSGPAGGVAVAEKLEVANGSVVIAAITSCTNTSNPSVMVGAGLLAKKAVEAGLQVQSHVKTSLAPGSRVVADYLEAAGVMPYLEALKFHIVGYGCTTCIGNSGDLPDDVAAIVKDNNLVAVSVLSGNRNFEGRINPLVKANYLASPMLVVAYALAGTVDRNLTSEPLGTGKDGKPVYLKDIWPSQSEIKETIARSLKPEMFQSRYAAVFEGDEQWQAMPIPTSELYEWDNDSTYLQEPPYFYEMPETPGAINDITGARALAVLGDSITTDHISPAGAIPNDSPTAKYLREHGVERADWNTYGSRRGNHEVMMRGTFGNIRLKNLLADGKEGGWTKYIPTGEVQSIYDAAMRYQGEGTPLVILAGKEYGTGSSRDWAAKGTQLLGVKAVIAESFERIHRSNLVGMGVLPVVFKSGDSWKSLGLDGTETYSITGIAGTPKPRQEVTVTATRSNGSAVQFQAVIRLDSSIEVGYYKNGGILQTVLRRLAKAH